MILITELNKENIEKLTVEELRSDEVLDLLFEEENDVERYRLETAMLERARTLGIESELRGLIRAQQRVEKKALVKQKKERWLIANRTNFEGKYDSLDCGNWLASENGIYKEDANNQFKIIQACYHPILPLERLKNLETGEEKIKIAFKRNHKWQEIIVQKSIISSVSKIVCLSDLGIAVTSENAKGLVTYLADVENLNEDTIKIQYSTSKLGWVGKDLLQFVPYDDEIIFDGDKRFRQLSDSIKSSGNLSEWFDHIKQLRAKGRFETKFMLAASFASVVVPIVGGLPFVVDLWGMTEGGKTVTLMVATSVWANPAENAYIGDFKTTDVALEVKADLLNNLPLILDDTSRTSRKVGENFEGIVYDLCSGKGKSRSNKELGTNRENHWSNCTLTNGERMLTSYVSQGGAFNRVLEVECGEHIYSSPQKTAETVKNNYGFAGPLFISALKKMGADRIKEIYDEFYNQLYVDDKNMQKQSMALAIVLTADKIATEELFMDQEYIPLDEAKKMLKSRDEVSDNQRLYEYIMDKVDMNQNRFEADGVGEKWGVIEDDYVIFIPVALEQLCTEQKRDKTSFLEWAYKNNLLLTDSGKKTKNKRIFGKQTRCIFLRRNENNEFISAENDENLYFE